MITIRKAGNSEWSVLQNLNTEVNKDNAKYDPDIELGWALSAAGKEYFKSLVNDAQSICLVAVDDADKKIVGYIAGSPKAILYRKSKYFEIDNMGVIPGYRVQGIGRRLIEGCTEFAKKQGYQKMFVNSHATNAREIGFYEKCGFEKMDLSLEKTI